MRKWRKRTSKSTTVEKLSAVKLTVLVSGVLLRVDGPHEGNGSSALRRAGYSALLTDVGGHDECPKKRCHDDSFTSLELPCHASVLGKEDVPENSCVSTDCFDADITANVRDVGCEGESTPCSAHETVGRCKLASCSRTLLTEDSVTWEGPLDSCFGIDHEASH